MKMLTDVAREALQVQHYPRRQEAIVRSGVATVALAAGKG